MQEIFGVGPCLGGACNATDLSDLYVADTIPNGIAAVPEATSIALFGTGLFGLGLMGRRRRD